MKFEIVTRDVFEIEDGEHWVRLLDGQYGILGFEFLNYLRGLQQLVEGEPEGLKLRGPDVWVNMDGTGEFHLTTERGPDAMEGPIKWWWTDGDQTLKTLGE